MLIACDVALTRSMTRARSPSASRSPNRCENLSGCHRVTCRFESFFDAPVGMSVTAAEARSPTFHAAKVSPPPPPPPDRLHGGHGMSS